MIEINHRIYAFCTALVSGVSLFAEKKIQIPVDRNCYIHSLYRNKDGISTICSLIKMP